MSRRDRREGAQISEKTSPGFAAASPAALHEAGVAHMQAGRYLEAQSCCERALAVDSGHADSLHLMGRLSFQAGQYDHAVEWIVRAIRFDPKADYLASLGTALHRQGRYDEAVNALDKAVQLKPEDAGLWTALGTMLEEVKRLSDAVLCFEHALKLDPRQHEAAWRSALLLHQLGRLEEALVRLDLCDTLRPRDAVAVNARSLVLRGLKRFDDYLAVTQQAHRLDPRHADLCNNVGDAYQLLGRFEEALAWFDRALERKPSSILALENKASLLRQMHRFDAIPAIYDRIRAIEPNRAKAEFDLGNLNLLLGNFAAGWRQREARWRVPDLPIHFPAGSEPVWLGEQSIEGKTILIYSDEGLGDAIQFARYVPHLAARGARVVLVVQDGLQSLLSTLPGLVQCLPRSAAPPPSDFRCPLMSLPLAFGTTLDTIPPPVPLSAPAERISAWDERLGVHERFGPHDRLRVGLTWSGSLAHPNDISRSIPLELLTGLLELDATFISLQKDPRPADREVLERSGIVDLTAQLTDFTETAALVSCLDLLITVDTSMAHLAPTLGCPTWIMLPHAPDYRWLLNRDDSPWYPAVRLFRQDASRERVGVIERVRAELSAAIGIWNGRAGGAL
jgi:tetratricopeptide (TPR) repeat protein